ncbi:hypothetical protein TVAG_001680 [Trichomonas vaginalis G3]|uniref:Uncharacterized protein n=1 Tax=Trichomonas vaginalis (strain ATCC PRA-98 / G3) TaxID=412133 RepID=A2FSX6_TRIV3|nr:hypothetical protein TVAGG3_0315910 [Trichomonas vaginalis G3]EAX91998.1 hypothetical protein TVAG_001680 [Trichomonas vaginalis G3]KAI5528953.1 hypothetical protein TVAGG3_0315910 [Trichomonas vaginalis G3]|eukprot:XP_001304928.1 hypothetical protein [Trichomonas vaginalis G3]
MSGNLSRIIQDAQQFLTKMEASFNDMQSKVKSKTISPGDYAQINKTNLETLENMIINMSKACITRTNAIETSLETLESNIRTVDGLMLEAKGKVGASIQKDYVKRQKIPENIQYNQSFEINEPVKINYGNFDEQPQSGEKINFDVLEPIGMSFKNTITDVPEVQLIYPKIRENWTLHEEFFRGK